MQIKSRSYNLILYYNKKKKRSFSINPLVPHSSRIRKDLFEFEFVHLESGFFSFLLFFFYSLPSFLKSHGFDPVESDPFSHRTKGTKSIRLIFRSKVLCEIFGFFPLPLSLSHRYSVWINFLLYESILLHSNSFPIPPKENPELDPKLTGWRELIHAVMHSSNRNQFSERSWLSCFGGSSEILSMTYVEGISIWSDRLRKARGSNGTGESIQKRQFFSIILVLVSDPGSVSPFFRDELLAPVLHFVSVNRGERGAQREEDCNMREQGGQPVSNIQHGFWQCNVVRPSCRSEWISLSTEGESGPASQEDSKLQILSR